MPDITQWEYKKISGADFCGDRLETELNQLGKEGWELSGTFSYGGGSGNGSMIFKRPKNIAKDSNEYGYSR